MAVGGFKAMLGIVARVVIGTVLGVLFLVAMIFAYASDLLSTQSRQRKAVVADASERLEQVSLLDKA